MEHRRYISLASWAARRRHALETRAAANADALLARLMTPLPEDPAPGTVAADITESADREESTALTEAA